MDIAHWTPLTERPWAAERTRALPTRLSLPSDPRQASVVEVPRIGPVPGSSSWFLDGWTTWVDSMLPSWTGDTFELTAWFAARTFAPGHDEDTVWVADLGGPNPVSLGHDARGRVVGRVGATVFRGDERLRPRRWHLLALRREGEQAELLVDGRVVARAAVHETTQLRGAVSLGRSTRSGHVGAGVPTAVAAGLLGEVILRGLPRRGTGSVVVGQPDVEHDRARFAHDRHRPQAHIAPPAGWMNEPHAAIEAPDGHHLFFQHNPNGPVWNRIGWGHLSSDDLVHWRDEPPALSTWEVSIAPDGIWSGSSILTADGSIRLYFTAGDFAARPDQSIARADRRGEQWVAEHSAVLTMPDHAPGVDAALVTGQFRDPFVWRDGRLWYMLVGAGIQGVGGTALLFRSPDGEAWEQLPPLFIGDVTRYPATGEMWELPVLLPVGMGADGHRRHALFVAPWWSGESPHHLQHVWHWIGTWDPVAGRFEPDDHEPAEFDGGGHLTGPSGTVLRDGRSILWTISQDGRTPEEQAVAGWAHNAGFPLELGLLDDRLTVAPVKELARLRQTILLELSEPSVAETEQAFEHVHGRLLEVLVQGEIEGDAEFTVGSGTQKVVIRWNPSRLEVDRSAASDDPRHREGSRGIDHRRNRVARLRVLRDGSMLEVYADDRVSLTTRFYPTGDEEDWYALRLDPRSRIDHLAIYELHPAFGRRLDVKGN
jgi:sucrose-6-phosphate hydrolase SacC (GH32 family)